MECRIGLDIGGTKMLLLADCAGQWFEQQIATGESITPSVIEDNLRRFLSHLGAPPSSAGFAVPGLIDQCGTVLESDVLPGLKGWNPHGIAEVGGVTAVLNDAEAALVEAAALWEPDATAAVVGAGTRIGAAFQVQGTTLRSVRSLAGEIGYLPLVWNSRLEMLDQLAGGQALLRRLQLQPPEIQQRAAGGDEQVLSAIRDAGMALGLGLVAILHLLSPALIGLYGGMLDYPGYADATLAAAHEYGLPHILSGCKITVMEDHRRVVAKGALRYAAHSINPQTDK